MFSENRIEIAEAVISAITAERSETHIPFLMRSNFIAPLFCPANVVAAIPNEYAIAQAKDSNLLTAALAATTDAPNELNSDWTITFEILKVVD